MHHYYDHHRWMIWMSFFIAAILHIMPWWPQKLMLFCPSWLNLLLIYWIMTLPHHTNIGTGFFIGLVMDLILGSTLGIHALAFSILAYLVVFKFQLLRSICLWQQTLIVILLSLITESVVFLAECLVTNVDFQPEIFWTCIANGILWPCILFLMRKIRCRFYTQFL
ncbi:rod shape-determining protein MreD [Candidatus Curculioniphilus buchneri]|uniref:rod shape-determining protein MreD n=1 Tax=Candidatus Curculioniphilus buchneri TaxID=690594 RepID=UPI00376F0F3C